ncbi:MAG: hypothetical protein AABX75_02850, partial [Nanoarchaeota archaeon]
MVGQPHHGNWTPDQQHLFSLAELKLANGKTEEAKGLLEQMEPRGFNPNLSNIWARIFRQAGSYEDSIKEDPRNAETWDERSRDANTPAAERGLYGAIADALKNDQIASLLFSARGEAAKKIFFRPWQEKLMRDLESVLVMSEKKHSDCLDDLNKYEGFTKTNRALER